VPRGERRRQAVHGALLGLLRLRQPVVAAGRVHLRRHQERRRPVRPARRARGDHARAALHPARGGAVSVKGARTPVPRRSRRRFAPSVGAGLLLSPFLSTLRRGGCSSADAAPAKQAKRLLLFCTMGTSPDLWTPTNVTGESSFGFTASTQPLAAIKDSI